MAIYLVDFENVHDIGLNGVTSLTPNDEVSIFYSVKSEHMSFDTHVNILQAEAKIKYIKLRRSAKNYLDFQLVTHLGYLIGSGAPGPFYIISKDTGYDSVLDYWKDHGVTVLRQPSIGYNRNQTKFTGQLRQPVTPPAQVTIKENNHITTVNPEDLLITTTQLTVPAVTALQAVPQVSEETEETPKDSPAEEAAPSGTGSRKKTRRNPRSRSSENVETEVFAPAKEEGSESAKNADSGDSPAEENAGKSNVKAPETAALSKETAPLPEKEKEGALQSASNKETASLAEAAADSAAPSPEFSPLSAPTAQEILMKPDSLPESYRKKVRTVLKGKNIPSAHYTAIYKALVNSYDKLALNNLLVKTFGSSKGGVVYNLVKDIFTDYHSA